MIEKQMDGIHFSAGHWPLDPDKDTMVFIHGAGHSKKFWQFQVTGLKDAINTVAVDLPGHGNSSGIGMDRVADYAGAMEAFVDALPAPSPMVCGISMGGAVSMQMLLNRKDRYRAGVIINSGARLKVSPIIFEMIQTDYRGYTDAFASMAASPKTDPLRLKTVIDDVAGCTPDIVYNDFAACDAFDVMGRLHKIAAPVLVLTAEGDKLTPVKYGQYLIEQIPDAHQAHIAGAGHLSPVEKPDEVNQAILKFLQKIGKVESVAAQRG